MVRGHSGSIPDHEDHCSFADAVTDVVPVLSVQWLLSAALHHRRAGQTHPRHGVSSVLGAGHQ